MAAGIETRLWSFEDVVALINQEAEAESSAPRFVERIDWPVEKESK